MSATPGKILVAGAGRVSGEEVFSLTFLQGRDPGWVGRPFFAAFDSEAAWFDELEPAFGRTEFFFEPRFREMKEKLAAGREAGRSSPSWAVRPRDYLVPKRRSPASPKPGRI